MNHEFVEYIPERLEEDVIYISVKFGTVIHKCCCGCGNEVVTPLSPTDWKLIFDGISISLYPSIGNWNFKCKSHYWITNNNIVWAEKWSDQKVNAGRQWEYLEKSEYYNNKESKFNTGNLLMIKFKQTVKYVLSILSRKNV